MTLYFALIIAATIPVVEIAMTYLALPTLTQLHGGDPAVIWIITAHYLVGASSAALGGRLGDKYGRRRVLVIVLTISGLGSLGSAMSTGLVSLVIGRGMQGVSAATLPLCFGIVREAVPKLRIPLIIGIIASVPGVAASIAYMAGGLLLDHSSWRSIFWCTALLDLAALCSVWRFTPRSHNDARQAPLDWVGGILFVPAVAGFLYAMNQAKSLGWGSPYIVGGVAACVLVSVAWVRHELRHADPLINVRLLANRQIALANICMILFATGEMQNVQALMFLFQQPSETGAGFGLSPSFIGLLQMPIIALNVAGGALSGRLATIRGSRFTALLGATVLTLAGAGIALQHTGLWLVIALNYLLVLGISTLFSAIANLIVEAAPMERTSEATGMNTVFRQMFLGVGSQMIGYLLATSISTYAGHGAATVPTDLAYTLVFSVTAVCSLLSTLAIYFIPGQARKAPPSKEVLMSPRGGTS